MLLPENQPFDENEETLPVSPNERPGEIEDLRIARLKREGTPRELLLEAKYLINYYYADPKGELDSLGSAEMWIDLVLEGI